MAKNRKQEQKIYRLISVIVVIIAVISVVVTNLKSDDTKLITKKIEPNDENLLIVHYLDVGQGDCEFIELPDGKCMLIDAGEVVYGDSVVKRIKNLGYTRVDYVIGTHPHTDHIGGMKDVIESLDVGEIYMPKASSNTSTFEKLLTAIKTKGLKVNTAKAGMTIPDGSGVSLEFLAPCSDSYEDLNNYSAVLRLEYNGISFLFTGDAENESEDEMLSYYYDELDCDVLKVGHHGSRYSSSDAFLDAVSPAYAVISCGADNSYGHPHKQALNRLYAHNAQVLRTDQLGEITVCCDGEGGFDIAYEMDN